MKSISVIIISYNQKDTIGRCLDSILCQKEFGLKEIVVCDDCSKDGTWDVLKSYALKEPGIIRIYQNDHNLGIYANSEKALSLRGEWDFYHQLAGDDALCKGWFRELQCFIEKESPDMNTPIGIYSDWKMIGPKSKEIVVRQDKIRTGHHPFSLYLRGMVCNRSLIVNNEVIKRFSPVLLDKGLRLAESLYDSQDHFIIEKAYYLPYIGSIYYSGMGVSSSLKDKQPDYYTSQVILTYQYFIEHLITDTFDKYYAMYNIEIAKFNINPNFKSFIKSIYLYHKGKMKGMRYGIKDYISAIRPLFRLLKYSYKTV